MTSPNTIYQGDNGALYCGEHLGQTARVTGRDRSGQKIVALRASDNREFLAATGSPISCETCGKRIDGAPELDPADQAA